MPLRPNGSHHYARVVSIAHNDTRSGIAQVEMEYKECGLIRSVLSSTPWVITSGLRVGDPVLFKQYRDLGKATEDGHLDASPILVVYSKEEEAELTANHGAFFPEVPPECLPAGYYG